MSSIYIEKQLLRTNYAKNPEFVYIDALTGWDVVGSVSAGAEGGVNLSHSGTQQTVSVTDSEISQGNMHFHLVVSSTHTTGVTLFRTGDDGTQSKEVSVVPGEPREVILTTYATPGEPIFGVRWTGSANHVLTLHRAYISTAPGYFEARPDSPGTFFSGDSPEFWTEDPTQQRSYEWAGQENNSFSYEFTGGFWTAEWLEPPAINITQPPAPRKEIKFEEQFAAEISYGLEWVSLHDHFNFKIAAADFGSKSVQHRRREVSSAFYDGTFLIHSTKENVTEQVGIYVYGQSQNDVIENLAMLEELFTQFQYHLRFRVGDNEETWYCMPADFSIERTHVYLHNNMALFKASVPRKPRSENKLII